jgi:hypothetical protein
MTTNTATKPARPLRRSPDIAEIAAAAEIARKRLAPDDGQEAKIAEMEARPWWSGFHKDHLARHGIPFREMPADWIAAALHAGVYGAPENATAWCGKCTHFHATVWHTGMCRAHAPRRVWPEVRARNFCSGDFKRRAP